MFTFEVFRRKGRKSENLGSEKCLHFEVPLKCSIASVRIKENVCAQIILPFAATCPSGWIESTRSGTCIKLYVDKKSWTDARAVCQASGGDLVKIVDDSMNQFIWGEQLRIKLYICHCHSVKIFVSLSLKFANL